jgi:hypothetical protein
MNGASPLFTSTRTGMKHKQSGGKTILSENFNAVQTSDCSKEIVLAGISTSQHIQQASFLFSLACKGEKQTLVICHFFSYQLEVPP